MKTYNTFLPIFPGLYNTIFEPDETNEIESVNQERMFNGLPEFDYDSFEFDYDTYNDNVVFYCCNYIEETLKNLGLKCSIKNSKLVSPKYYNFSNDSINIDIEIDLKKVIAYLKANFDEFEAYIKEKYTSRSGFISWYSNNAKMWLNKEIKESPDHCIGAVLDFIVKNEIEDPKMEMYESIMDNYIFCINYDELIN